jgi:predicted SAM-dependent methyltransferase
MKLDIGCGASVRAGYLGVDLRELPGVAYVCAAKDILSFCQEGSVEEIYCRHMLEHLTRRELVVVLSVWFKALQGRGKLEVIVPDLAYHASQILSPNQASEWSEKASNLTHALGSIYGWQSNEFDFHKQGFIEELLIKLLEEAGFVEVYRADDKPWNLRVIGVKGL